MLVKERYSLSVVEIQLSISACGFLMSHVYFIFFPSQPWTLDNSISEENREIIESMLLEEQYPYLEFLISVLASR